MTTSSRPLPALLHHPSSERLTRRLELPQPDRRPQASGLYVTELNRYFLFEQLKPKREDGRFAIGTGYKADIQLPYTMAEPIHALLEWRDGAMHIIDNTAEHLTFVDGWQLVESASIRLGMIIKVGEIQMIGTSERGTVPITAETVSEFCREACKLLGGHRSAARQLGRSHNFIRNQFIPRDQRYNRKQSSPRDQRHNQS